MKRYCIDKPFVLVIYGASGDLAKLKLFPALYELAFQKRLPKNFYIIGYARTEKSREAFRNEFKKSVEQFVAQVNSSVLQSLLQHVEYFTGGYDDIASFQNFSSFVLSLAKQKKYLNLHYLAVPPDAFSFIIESLASLRSSFGSDMRLIIEKPFGNDEASARSLFHQVSMHFPQEKVFLLDHYLGKEAVQSILPLRYANSILNTLLSGPLIANIQISALEDFGVEKRIHYFDQVGILKDMVQSHLLQLLALLTMELPVEPEKSDNIHREKCAVLSALKSRGYEHALVLGQHSSYQKIAGVEKGSTSPTFAALRLFIDRQNWYHVPIYIRTGKMLKEKHTYIVIEFKKHPFQSSETQMNQLILELQPDEKLHLKLFTKKGGEKSELHQLTTSESLACFGDDCLPEHGKLLLNVFQNDHTHFLEFEEIIASWKFTDKILKFAQEKNISVLPYDDYSFGPREQYEIPRQDGFEWSEIPLHFP